jgi:hypothetical protein
MTDRPTGNQASDNRDSELSRRGFLRGSGAAAAGALAARGIYTLLDDFAAPPRAWAAATTGRKQEQYLIDSLEVILDNNITVVVPPVYNDVFTARLARAKTWNRDALRAAQSKLETALGRVESPYPSTAAGLTIVVAWGLSYFRSYVPGPWDAKAPVDKARSAVVGVRQLAVLDRPDRPFPSDPADVVWEDNHVAIKLRSDSADILRSVERQLFDDPTSRAYVGDILEVTSKRIGFLGRGFGTASAGKALARAAGVPGADLIPDRAQLMLGFTSTQTQALGPGNLVNFETLPGLTDQFPSGYFARGCAMHLSHLRFADLTSWYGGARGGSYADRVARMITPRATVPTDEATVTLPNGPSEVSTQDQVRADAAAGLLGHNGPLQMATRLGQEVVDNYGFRRPKGTAVPVREDFNTLDNPFHWYVDASGQVRQPTPNQPGMHFAVFIPSSDRFHKARLSMDGLLPDGSDLRQEYNLTDAQIGINAMMAATHRQNFLVPPRAHRSFPLAELL